MRFELVPLLRLSRDLYDQPRGSARFERYLKTMLDESGDDVRYLPMVAMNPMGKAHVQPVFDHLLAIDAEGVASRALREAEGRLAKVEGSLKLGLTVADDLAGGWTHRESTEANGLLNPVPALKRGWIGFAFWTGTPNVGPEDVRVATLEAAFRGCYQLRHGPPRTLGDVLRQEGLAARFGGRAPRLSPEPIGLARRTLAPHLESKVFATIFAGMFGDRAAKEVGHRPLGLPERAGFEVGLADAPARPEDSL